VQFVASASLPAGTCGVSNAGDAVTAGRGEKRLQRAWEAAHPHAPSAW